MPFLLALLPALTSLKLRLLTDKVRWIAIGVGLLGLTVGSGYAGYNFAVLKMNAAQTEQLKAQKLAYEEELLSKQMVADLLEKKLLHLQNNPVVKIKERRVEYVKPLYVGCIMPLSGVRPINDNIEKVNKLLAE
jgi:hypothetical protein